MSKLISMKADGTLNISVESNLLETIHKTHAWYTSNKTANIILLIIAAIDIVGFYQIFSITIPENIINQIIIISAFAGAFEIATLYIGYAISLKCYNLGRPIHNIVLILSIISFGLGIIANTIYRWMTMDFAYQDIAVIALPMTIVMIILPIITSLINIVVGCLAFDPLLFDLQKLSKKLKGLRTRKLQLESHVNSLPNDTDLANSLIDSENTCYNNTKIEIAAMRLRLRNYIIIKSLTMDKDQEN